MAVIRTRTALHYLLYSITGTFVKNLSIIFFAGRILFALCNIFWIICFCRKRSKEYDRSLIFIRSLLPRSDMMSISPKCPAEKRKSTSDKRRFFFYIIFMTTFPEISGSAAVYMAVSSISSGNSWVTMLSISHLPQVIMLLTS